MSFLRSFQSTDLLQQVNITGLYNNKIAKIFTILGRRTNFVNNTGMHDISDINPTLTVFPTVTSAESLEIVSTNANDTLLGTGVRTVRVLYINSLNNLATADINLNGTTAVAAGFTANEIIEMESIDTGTNTVAVGNVILRKVTGAVQLEIISAGGNKSMSAKFMVPAGYTGYLLGGNFAAISQTQDFRLRANVKTFDRSLNVPYVFQHNFFLAIGQNSGELNFDFLKYPALSKIKVSSISGATAGNPRADCSFTILIIEN